MRRSLALMALLIIKACTSGTPAAVAQSSTTVSSSGVVDTDGFTWSNGIYQISFVPNASSPSPGSYVWTGGVLTTSFSGSLSGSGTFSISLPSNNAITPVGSQWKFTLCPNATQGCFSATTAVVGATYDVTSIINAAAVGPRFPANPQAFGYGPVEVTPNPVPGAFFFNTTSDGCQQWTGSAWASCASGVGSGYVLLSPPGNALQTVTGPLQSYYSPATTAPSFAAAAAAVLGYNSLGSSEADIFTQTRGTNALAVLAPNSLGNAWQTLLLLHINGDLAPTGSELFSAGDGIKFAGTTQSIVDDNAGGISYSVSSTATSGHSFFKAATLLWQMDPSGNFKNPNGTIFPGTVTPYVGSASGGPLLVTAGPTGSGAPVLATSPTIATPTISNPTVTTGTFTSPTINTPAISTPTITGGSLSSPTITTPTVTGGTYSSPSLTTPTISNPTVTTGTFSSPAITTPTVTGGTFGSSPAITTPTVTGGTFSSPAISTPTITGGTASNFSLTGTSSAPTGGSCASNTNIATQAYVANCSAAGSGVNSLALTTTGSSGAATGNITGATLTLNIPNYTAGSSFITSLTTTGTSGAANVSGGVLNIPNYSQTFSSLTTTGTSGAASLSGGVLNIPQYAGAVASLTTTGTTGNASLSGGVLNVPNYTSPVQSLTTNGTSGAATLSGGVLNVPSYTSTSITNTTFTPFSTATAVAANTCTAAATFTMTGVITSPQSNVWWGWQGNPHLTTGWGAVGGLQLDLWVSAANTVSWTVCNQTAASITSGTPSFIISAQ